MHERPPETCKRAPLHRRLAAWIIAWLLALLASLPTLASAASLDLRQWMHDPSVELVVVEFTAPSCGSCIEAIPRWRALRQKYGHRSLRIVVVQRGNAGLDCPALPWQADGTICDSDGNIGRELGQGFVPASWLWASTGKILVEAGTVETVARRVALELDAKPAAARRPVTLAAARKDLDSAEALFAGKQFAEATKAYRRVAAHRHRETYLPALFMIARSAFELSHHTEAASVFITALEYITAAGGARSQVWRRYRKEAVTYAARSLTAQDWDGDGCADFGQSEPKAGCPRLDWRWRQRLYASSIVDPRVDAHQPPDWRTGHEGKARAALEAAFEARSVVRNRLKGRLPHVGEIARRCGDALVDQGSDETFRQALVVFRHIIRNYPTERDALPIQRKVIRATDLLAAGLQAFEMIGRRYPRRVSAKEGLEAAKMAMRRQSVERLKYVEMFAKGTPWRAKWRGDATLPLDLDKSVGRAQLQAAKLIHSSAQDLRAAGREKEAIPRYHKAAREYEKVLLAAPKVPEAYELTWTLADLYFFASRRCDGLRTQDADLLTGADGELVPWPIEVVSEVKAGCESLRKSVAYYESVHNWIGARGQDDDGKQLDYAEDALFSAVIARERILNFRAALPATDPARLPARAVPELRPRDEPGPVHLVPGKRKVIRVKRKALPAAAVLWLRAADRYLAAGHTNTQDPQRGLNLALKAAELLFKNNHFDPWKEGAADGVKATFWSSRDRFWWVIKNHPKSEQAIESAKNLMISFDIERNDDELKKVSKYVAEHDLGRAVQVKSIHDPPGPFHMPPLLRHADELLRKAEVQHLLAEAASGPAEAKREHKKARKMFEEAGDAFRAMQAKSGIPEQKLAALMNAQLLYYKARRWKKCFDVLDEAEKMLRAVNEVEKDANEQKKNHKRLLMVIKRRAELQSHVLRMPK